MKNKTNKTYAIKPMKTTELLKVKGGYKAAPGPVVRLNRFGWEDIEIRFQSECGSGSRKNSPRATKLTSMKPK